MKRTDMKQTGKRRQSLTMLSIFRAMMEGGYYPKFNKTHITFSYDDNIAVVEYEEGILSVRLFFTIDKEAYDLFIEASNQTMLESFIVKPVILDDMKTIMFSCETFCDNIREFRKLFPRCIRLLEESLVMHKKEIKILMAESDRGRQEIPATDRQLTVTGINIRNKIIS